MSQNRFPTDDRLIYGTQVKDRTNDATQGIYIGDGRDDWVKIAQSNDEHSLKNYFELRRSDCLFKDRKTGEWLDWFASERLP